MGLRFIESLRAVRRVVLFGLFAWKAVGLSSLHLCVCSFVRRRFLHAFWELGAPFGESWGPLGFQLGSSGVAWAPFWGLCGSLLFISGALGCSWAPFWGRLSAWGGPRWLFCSPWQPQSFPSQERGNCATPPTLDFGALACTGCYSSIWAKPPKNSKCCPHVH